MKVGSKLIKADKLAGLKLPHEPKLYQGRLVALGKAVNARNQRQLLCLKTHHAVRSCSDVSPLKAEEVNLVCELTLPSWDRLLDTLADWWCIPRRVGSFWVTRRMIDAAEGMRDEVTATLSDGRT